MRAAEEKEGWRLFPSKEVGRITKWVLLSALIGVLGGLAAGAFKLLIEIAREIAFQRPTGIAGEGVGVLHGRSWLLPLIPAAGGLVTGWLVQRFAPEAEGHGTDSVIRAFHRLRGVVRKRVIALKALSSAITIGTGGSAGQEGPVAQVGGGVGSAIASALELSDRDRRIFLLSGSTAGIGAMFCAPLGGALFMPEVLYEKPEFEGEVIIPCIISSIVAYTTFSAVSGVHRAVEIAPEVQATLRFDQPVELVIYLVLGVLCAAVGWVHVKLFWGLGKVFARLRKVPRFLRPALGGLALGLLALAIAPAAGEFGVLFGGYELMGAAISGSLFASVAVPGILLLLAAKILATALTISSGGSGGVFAPSLAIGGLLGAAVGHAAAALFPALHISPACYALVGMGGFFAGVAKVPIASVILVSEMTGTYALLAPLMLVSVVHMLFSRRWTLYQAQVPSQVDSPAHAGDFVVDVLETIKVADVIGDARMPRLVNEDVTLRGAMRIVADSHETHFPVVDDEEQLVGIFTLSDLRRIFLEEGVGDFVIVRDFMREQVVTVRMDDNLDAVQRKMTRHNITAVPVVDDANPRRVIALFERNSLGRAYGQKLKELRSANELDEGAESTP